jgi:hypothetical protein
LLPDAPAAEGLLARAKAADLRAFRELVRSASVDQTTKLRGGDLSYFDVNGRLFDDEAGSVDAATAKAAFGLREVGDTSDVVKLGPYAGIVRLTGIRPAQNDPYAKVEQRLRMRLWRDRRQAAIDTHLDSLKRQLNVRVRPSWSRASSSRRALHCHLVRAYRADFRTFRLDRSTTPLTATSSRARLRAPSRSVRRVVARCVPLCRVPWNAWC